MSKINSKNLIVIIIVSFVLISANTGGLFIYALDEAKNSVCAREMMEQGQLIVPTFNYELRTDKPPLHYYFMIAAYQVFGVNAFAARFFSVIMGVLTVLTTFFLSVRYLGQRTALYSTLVLLSSLHFILQFHMAVPDPYLIFFVTLGFAAFFVFYKENKAGYLLASYLSFGLGVLAKGPVAVILPGLAILIFLIITRTFNGSYFLKLKPLWILGVLVFIIAPWFIMVGIKTGGVWLKEFFFYHNLERYTGTMEGHGAVFLVTPIMVLIGLLPFTIFFIQSFRRAWKRRKEEDILLYSAILSLTFVIFFAFSKTKLPNYTVPAYPFLAILIGRFLSVIHDNLLSYKRSILTSLYAYLVLAAALPAGLYIGLKMDPVLASYRYLSFYFLVIPIGALMAIIFIYRVKFKGMLLSLSVSWIVSVLLFFYVVFPEIDKANPVARLLPEMNIDKPVVAYRIYNSAFSFYIRKPIPVFDTPVELNDYMRHTGEGYIITRKIYEQELSQIQNLEMMGEAKDIFEIPTTIIYEINNTLDY